MVPEASVIPCVADNLHLSAFPCITPASQLLIPVHQACLQSLSSTKLLAIVSLHAVHTYWELPASVFDAASSFVDNVILWHSPPSPHVWYESI